jgi:hypothetical protein
VVCGVVFQAQLEGMSTPSMAFVALHGRERNAESNANGTAKHPFGSDLTESAQHLTPP